MEIINGQESETALLSILIKYPEEFYNLSIGSYMFSSSMARDLFDVITDVNKNDSIPTHSLLVAYLNSSGLPNKTVLIDYLNYLNTLEFDKGNLQAYADNVVRNYKTYKTLSVTHEIAERVNSGEDINRVISSAKFVLDKLSDDGNTEKVISIHDSIEKVWNEIVDRYENPQLPGVSTGFKTVDPPLGGLSRGDLMVIASRPSMGKTSVICNMALNMCENGVPVSIFSLEDRAEVLLSKLIAIKSKISINNIRIGKLTDKEILKIKDAVKFLKQLPLFIDTNFYGDISTIMGTTKKLQTHHGIRVAFVDYIQLLAKRDMDATNEIGRISRRIKLMANDLGISFVVASQLNRMVESRDNKRPMLSDLRQSGNLEEDADIVVMLYRENYYKPTEKNRNDLEFILRKNRNGPTGIVKLGIDLITNRVYDV